MDPIKWKSIRLFYKATKERQRDLGTIYVDDIYYTLYYLSFLFSFCISGSNTSKRLYNVR